MHLLSVKSVKSPKVVWTGFHYLPWLAQNFEGVGGMSSLLILDVYGLVSKVIDVTLVGKVPFKVVGNWEEFFLIASS